jgi:glycerol-1-phosphate dehydrogenase [NAD(P)+]
MPAAGGTLMDQFPLFFGRQLAGEFDAIARRPYLVVTMDDLWPRFAGDFGSGLGGVHLVRSLERRDLDQAAARHAGVRAVIGVGGGQAIDVAKYLAWQLGAQLFQLPTALSVNAPFSHRAGIRENGVVRYVGWALPEAVWLDWDVVRSAPPLFNRCGAGDILCYHTAHWDWQYAAEQGRCEEQWPYDAALVAAAAAVKQQVIIAADDIRELTDSGIRALAAALKWGGSAFGYDGWNPRHIEGSEHFLFYSLEAVTGRKFIHGQAVSLGIVIMSALQDNQPEEIRAAIDRIGITYRPADMGVTWDDVAAALRRLPQTVAEGKLWYTIASDHVVSDAFIDSVRDWIESGGTFDRSALASVEQVPSA